MESKLLFNALIVNEGVNIHGALLIEGERIVKIFKEPFPICNADVRIDVNEDLLLPGVIDDQVHFREPGLVHKGDIATESAAAIAGGITSYLEMPNTNPQTTTTESILNKHEAAAGRSAANYSFYLGATNTNLDEILRVDTKLVCGIKVFMGSSTGNMLVNDPESLTQIFSQSPLLIATHCEDEATIIANAQRIKKEYGEYADVSFHPKVRDVEACYRSSSLAVELASRFNTRLHVLHISTKKEMGLFSSAALSDKKITAEVCVHHLWFSDDDYANLGTRIKWNPAIKSKSDRDALRESLLQGKIDVVATDHAPHLLEEKEGGCFKGASGGPLVQHSLVAMLEMHHQGLFSVDMIVQKMCHNPAILFQIKDRGFIREGYYADLVRVSMNHPWQVNKSNLLYKCKWSPFEEQTFQARVEQTFVNGSLVYEDGRLLQIGKGQPLQFVR